MSLLDDFGELLTTINVFEFEDVVDSWGVTKSEYPTTATRTITGFIQPVSGSAVFKNQARGVDTTHKLFIYATESLNDTDKITFDGETFYITDNQMNGISGVNDHKEIGLKRG